MKKLSLFSIALAITAVVGALQGAPTASAASSYDGAVYTQNHLTLNGADYSKTWLNLVEEECTNNNAHSALLEVIESDQGKWSVQQQSEEAIGIIFSDRPSATMGFFGETAFGLLAGSEFKMVKLEKNGADITCGFYPLETAYSDTSISWVGLPANYGFLFINFPITYPTDYEGEIIRETYQDPDDAVKDEVKFDFIVNDKHLILTNKTPKDWLPEGAICQWQIDTNPMDELEREEAGVPFEYDLLTADNCYTDITYDFEEYGNYHIILEVLNADKTPHSSAGKDIEVDGSIFSGTVSDDGLTNSKSMDLSQCFTETFPFIDVKQCRENLGFIFSRISLSRIVFPDWSFAPQCRTIPMFGNWLNIGEYTVCPAIPEKVRDVTTPFVGFMLGIVTLGILHKRRVGEM